MTEITATAFQQYGLGFSDPEKVLIHVESDTWIHDILINVQTGKIEPGGRLMFKGIPVIAPGTKNE